eukprot:6177235-Pleurochrysis_carterae.AAC.1
MARTHPATLVSETFSRDKHVTRMVELFSVGALVSLLGQIGLGPMVSSLHVSVNLAQNSSGSLKAHAGTTVIECKQQFAFDGSV